MIKRLMTCALGLAMVAGCSSNTNGSTGTTTGDNGSGPATSGSSGTSGSVTGSVTGSTGSSGTTSPTGASSGNTASSNGGSTGDTGTTACPANGPATIADLRNPSCVDEGIDGGEGVKIGDINGYVLYSGSYGMTDGGKETQYAVNYVILDSSGLGMALYHSKTEYAPYISPVEGDYLQFSGYLGLFPYTATSVNDAQIQVSDVNFYDAGAAPGAFPTPTVASMAQIAQTSQGAKGGAAGVLSDTSLVGHYITVPAGTYTQDNTEAAFVSGKYNDGFSLTSNGSKILVDTYVYEFSTPSPCNPDGGAADYSAGGFNGFLDLAQTDDGAINYVVFLGNCGK